jgi:hypothetical protein
MTIEKEFIHCKHTIKYTICDKSEETDEQFIRLSKSNIVTRDLLKSFKNCREVYYEDLNQFDKKTIDESWEKYDDSIGYDLMRCSEHCGNTVREVR